MAATRGRLVILDGAEGVGKSTQAARLREHLAIEGEDVELIREPGGTPVGEEIREILLSPGRDLPAATEALLFMASRALVIMQRIEPALERGATVIADRFFLSTYAYQIAGRGLPEEEVRMANRLATGGLIPDLTLLLDLPVEGALARAIARGGGSGDRIEDADAAFHRRVAAAFSAFATAEWQRRHPECGPIERIDASGSADAVFDRILAGLRRRWPETSRVGTKSG